ncbi:MAG: hypothetical protein QF915_00410 [Candidatus Woesearchaeota archaeon]|jgi:hypothetical protein|nr:hypothetical protein [Candidatus Woesearchaeota archaeon]MDP7458561.1 hypothetical protein [Candidatus Woesearchaeota archaeon]
MSQIEQDFGLFLAKRPEIEKAYQDGLINRRALARYLIKQGVAKNNQFDALVAMLRRYKFGKIEPASKDIFKAVTVNMKDNILILDFEKEKSLLQKLQKLFASANYDRGDTLKVVVGSSTIKVFIDEKNEKLVNDLIKEYKLHNKLKDISEMSLFFDVNTQSTKGIMSTISRMFLVHDINIVEILTSSPELIIYLDEKDVVRAYELLKGF